MLFTVTQIEGNEGVLERCHYINISGDTETDVLYKFSFPVLFSVHLIFFFFQIYFHAFYHDAVWKVWFFSLPKPTLISLQIRIIETKFNVFPPFLSSLSPHFLKFLKHFYFVFCHLHHRIERGTVFYFLHIKHDINSQCYMFSI